MTGAGYSPDPRDLEDPALLADAHQLAGITEMSVDVDRGLEHFDTSIEYFEASPPPRVQFRIGPNPGVVSHVISGLLLWAVGYPDRAQRRVDHGLGVAARTGHPYTRAYALFHASLLAVWGRDLPRAARHAPINSGLHRTSVSEQCIGLERSSRPQSRAD